MDSAGVHRTILVPPSWEGERNDVVLAACKAYPERFRFAARLAFNDPAGRDFISSWRTQAGMVALQLTFQNALFQKPLLNGEVDWMWAAAERAGLPLKVYI